MHFINPQDAFNQAIARGLFFPSLRSAMYAGNWMYMHTDAKGAHHFKHIFTRRYVSLTALA